MKRVFIAVCTVIGLVALPRVAYAGFWAWLQELSGPGRFHGSQFDIRLACVGRVLTPENAYLAVRNELGRAQLLLGKNSGARSATEAARADIDTILRIDIFHPVEIQLRGEKEKTLRSTRELLDLISGKAHDILGIIEKQTDLLQAAASVRRAVQFVETTGRALDNQAGTFLSAAGIAASLCDSTSAQSRASIGVVARFMDYTDARPNPYAGGNTIHLNTLGGSVTAHAISGLKHPRMDVVDFGFALSVYWVSSDGSPSSGAIRPFRGVMVEPLRLDFHLPSALRQQWWGPAVPYLQMSWAGFPAGFVQQAFVSGSDAKADQIGGHLVRTYGYFWDLQAIVAAISKR